MYHWSRQFLSILALAAALAALVLIVHDRRIMLEIQASMDQAATESGVGEPGSGQSKAAGKSAEDAETMRYRAVSDYVARRYRVSQDVAFRLVHLAHQAGREWRVDPLLIIAVMAVESSFNPIAESRAGAKGLMQIIPKYHSEKLEPYGGEQAIFDPATNIRVGARILREYIRNTGNVGIALQMYAGALSDHEDLYTNRVMGMKQRLQYVVAKSTKRRAAPAPMRTAAVRNHSSGTAID